MTTCPHASKVRPELPPLTDRIAKLPVDERGYPVPFFVQWLTPDNQSANAGDPGARPEFRMMDGRKWAICYKEGRCWVCGQIMLRKATFVIGPMCGINRTSSECPCHYECAVWSAKGCPFLTRPHMVRREDDLILENKPNTPGISIDRNPGVMLLWTSNTYKMFRVPAVGPSTGGLLMNVGDPLAVEFWREGRKATRAEIMESIDSGMPKLREMCELEQPQDKDAAHAELTQRYDWMVQHLVPKV